MVGLIHPIYDELCGADSSAPVVALVEEHVVLARLCRQNQAPRRAIEILHAAACVGARTHRRPRGFG